MKLVKRFSERWETEDKRYSVSVTHCRIKGLYPKYYVSGGRGQRTYASSLKEAREIIDRWESSIEA